MMSADDYRLFDQRLTQILGDRRYLVEGHYLSLAAPVTPRIQLPFARKFCSAGHRGMVILPTGQIQTCGFLGPLGEKALGKVPEERFSEIWKRLSNSDPMAELESNLPLHNARTQGPATNCLAIALAGSPSGLIQVRGQK